MKKLLLSLALFAAVSVQAQTRYLDEIFTDVQVDTSVQYAENYEFFSGFATLKPLVADIYTPVGDTATNRPIILLSHNGSFLPESFTFSLLGLCFNGRKDSSLVEMSKRLARRGYVAVSFDYRLGWNPTSPDQEVRTQTIIQAVYRAQQDAKALVRFFKNDFANNGNQYGVDTGKIVIGGSNSGAYVALAAGSLNDTAELTAPKFVGTNGQFIRQDTLGDFDGFGGVQNHDNYPGISSRFQGVLALGGAVGDTSWIQPGEPPVIAFHGLDETGTPYNTGIVTTTTGQPVIEVSGAGDFMLKVEALGNNDAIKSSAFPQSPPNRNGLGQQTAPIEGLYPFYGQYFEPWNWFDPTCYDASAAMQGLSDPINASNRATPAKGNRYLDTIFCYTLPRLYKLLIDPSFNEWTSAASCNYVYEWTSIRSVEEAQANLFPNPTTGKLNITTEQKLISSVRLFDITGKLVKEISEVNAFNTTLDVSEVHNGIYFASIQLADGRNVTRKAVVEK